MRLTKERLLLGHFLSHTTGIQVAVEGTHTSAPVDYRRKIPRKTGKLTGGPGMGGPLLLALCDGELTSPHPQLLLPSWLGKVTTQRKGGGRMRERQRDRDGAEEGRSEGRPVLCKK